MSRTPIEWVIDDQGKQGFTVNPIRARAGKRTGHFCEKVSAGCANCYASALQWRFGMYPFEQQHRKKIKFFLDHDTLNEVLRRREATSYFWEDMSDIFGKWVPDKWIDACIAVMVLTSKDIHMILTKRAARMRAYFDELGKLSTMERTARLYLALPRKLRPPTMPDVPFPIPRLRVGVSIEDQPSANERLPQLLRTQAWERMLSYEPALGQVTLKFAACTCAEKIETQVFPKVHDAGCLLSSGVPIGRTIGRVIIGGESGAKARWFYLGWLKSMIRQCDEIGLPVFVKQLGRKPTMTPIGTNAWEQLKAEGRAPKIQLLKLTSSKGGDMREWPPEYQRRVWPRASDHDAKTPAAPPSSAAPTGFSRS